MKPARSSPDPLLLHPPADVEVIVDASNVARSLMGEGRLALLNALLGFLNGLGYRVVVVADASLRHVIDRKAEYEKMVSDGRVIQTPPASTADSHISLLARRYVDAGRSVLVISNDRFVEGLGLPTVSRVGFLAIEDFAGRALVLGTPFLNVLPADEAVVVQPSGSAN